MRLNPCLSAREFTTDRNHGKLSDSVPSRSNIASLYLGMMRPRPCSTASGACQPAPLLMRFSITAEGTSPSLTRSLIVEEFMEAKNGTRTSALARGRADTGDHSAVAVLRPLIKLLACQSGSVVFGGPVFLS